MDQETRMARALETAINAIDQGVWRVDFSLTFVRQVEDGTVDDETLNSYWHGIMSDEASED